MAYAEEAEIAPLHEPQTFLTKYIWSQDHKVIAIQIYLVRKSWPTAVKSWWTMPT